MVVWATESILLLVVVNTAMNSRIATNPSYCEVGLGEAAKEWIESVGNGLVKGLLVNECGCMERTTSDQRKEGVNETSSERGSHLTGLCLSSDGGRVEARSGIGRREEGEGNGMGKGMGMGPRTLHTHRHWIQFHFQRPGARSTQPLQSLARHQTRRPYVFRTRSAIGLWYEMIPREDIDSDQFTTRSLFFILINTPVQRLESNHHLVAGAGLSLSPPVGPLGFPVQTNETNLGTTLEHHNHPAILFITFIISSNSCTIARGHDSIY